MIDKSLVVGVHFAAETTQRALPRGAKQNPPEKEPKTFAVPTSEMSPKPETRSKIKIDEDKLKKALRELRYA